MIRLVRGVQALFTEMHMEKRVRCRKALNLDETAVVTGVP